MMMRVLALGLAATAAALDSEEAAPWDVAIGRRPYITETEGELLVQLDASVLGKPLLVTAALPAA